LTVGSDDNRFLLLKPFFLPMAKPAQRPTYFVYLHLLMIDGGYEYFIGMGTKLDSNIFNLIWHNSQCPFDLLKQTVEYKF